jgi:hypothetical protein
MNITEWNKEHESAGSELYNSSIPVKANLSAMWSYPNSSEPDVMNVQNNVIKTGDSICQTPEQRGLWIFRLYYTLLHKALTPSLEICGTSQCLQFSTV